MAQENRGPGRPPKAPGEKLARKVSLGLTDHQQKVLDALVDDERKTNWQATQPDLLRGLIKAEYARRVRDGMTPVVRNG